MRIFYKLHLSGNHDEAEVLSIGLSADNGLSAYAEVNDYSRDKIDKEADEDIVSEFIGKSGMEDMIAEKKKVKGLIAPLFRVYEFVQGFFHPYNSIELVGHGHVQEMKTMLDFIAADESLFEKQLTIANFSDELIERHEYRLNETLISFPYNNALRRATFLKHVARAYEES